VRFKVSDPESLHYDFDKFVDAGIDTHGTAGQTVGRCLKYFSSEM